MFEHRADIAIAGAGPAGLALGAALSARGASVLIVDPTPTLAWTNRYGAWAHDLEHTAGAAFEARRWNHVSARTGSDTRRLPGAYTTVNGQGLRNHLRSSVADHGGRFVPGRITNVAHDPRGSAVVLDDGRQLQATAVVDATGRGSLVSRKLEPQAFQAAFGMLVRVTRHPWAVDQATLMDFGREHLDAASQAGPPTFLYALPESSEVVFVEETSLAAAPAMSMSVLEARLRARLAHLGVEILEVLHVERCLIPMDGSIPDRGRVVPFGASAGYVHPATGYQLTRTLGAADRVADALVAGGDPIVVAHRAWATLWPNAERRTRALHTMGLGLLLSLDASQTTAFFDAFFSMPEPEWRAYLDATSAPGAVARAMTRAFSQVPGSLRRTIVAHAIGAGRTQLLAAVSPQLGGAS